MGKTIKELADELGVSKTAIRKYMTPEFREQHVQTQDGNLIVIDDDGCKLLVESLRKPPQTSANQFAETTENQGLRSEITFLREQLQVKDKQIDALHEQLKEKDRQISNLTELADHAQQLHAGSLKLLPDGGKSEAVDVDPDRQEPKRRWFWWFQKEKE